ITSGNYKFVNNLKGIINTTYYYDTVTVSFGTTVVAGKIWDNITKQAGNDIIFSYRMPFRSDNTGWDGAETEMLYSIDGGTNYITMGNTGHNGGVMNNNASGIGSISGTVFLDIQAIRDATQVRFKYLHRSYAGTVRINETHNIATGVRGIFWNSITVQEVGR
ncbi:MAG: hypothetical protein KAI79_14190, partial [Bacteroidales bacterium]|nr:hypothetical protein [Bacteroidales bacterium]